MGCAISKPLRGQVAFVVDGARTPFLDTCESLPVDLALGAGRPLLLRQPFAAVDLDEVVLGCVAPASDEPNPGRAAAARLGAEGAAAWTVQQHLASGLRAVDDGCRAIAAGRADLVLAGGVEARSRRPDTLSAEAAVWLAQWRQGSATERARLLTGLRPVLQSPGDGPADAADDGAADALAYRFGIRRAEADRFALDSHRRAAEAVAAGRFSEVESLFAPSGAVHAADERVRPDLTLEALAALDPIRTYGDVTAGNRCGDAAGAAWLLLASAAACARWRLAPRGRVAGCRWIGVPGELTGLAPVYAATALLRRHGLTPGDVDAWELEESSATEVLACLAAWRDPVFSAGQLGLDAPVCLDRDRLNADGGAIALGCPLGAAGPRIVLRLLEVLRRRGGRWGIAALGAAGGQGGALLVEAL